MRLITVVYTIVYSPIFMDITFTWNNTKLLLYLNYTIAIKVLSSMYGIWILNKEHAKDLPYYKIKDKLLPALVRENRMEIRVLPLCYNFKYLIIVYNIDATAKSSVRFLSVFFLILLYRNLEKNVIVVWRTYILKDTKQRESEVYILN